MMRLQRETNGRRQLVPYSETGPFKNRLLEAKAALVTAVLAGKSCYVQSDDAPLRYRLLTDTALRLAELNQAAAYFDLSSLAYQYDLATWVNNSSRLLAIQLNLPLHNRQRWQSQDNVDPIETFVQFLGEVVLNHVNQPLLLSFDDADRLARAPLAAEFWRLLHAIQMAQLHQPDFQRLTLVLWGETLWQTLAENGRFPAEGLQRIIL